MVKRVLVLTAVAAAFAVPALARADGGGSNSTPATAAKGGHAAAVLDRVSRRVDRRFSAFSKRCLVANAPTRCTKAATRLVRRLDRLQGVLERVESTLKQKCASASPPARCANASRVTGAIDALLGKIASDVAAIKAAFPNSGS